MKAENFSETFNQEVADRYHSLATLSFPSKGGLISEGIARLIAYFGNIVFGFFIILVA